ncbi:beta-1,3-galactosyltransferase brn-like isoform X1 [Maniola hyperantus]|uniref:beta-1,3-galactosyltransferase brn-like isoform X1 n=1 Tax=Aphantopus hyperantus TaxID=2795564 RepID=UPI0015697E73|nr:beta-1,3-galactosyltransferase brn-like isoform X1 [Maniola hyperantus]XP_034830702.1 beta-1,3-galactosyltransferase brn-like isoform X1 [Maniola hyperantus]XP_034830703.1 beta-1,3-galactosyltransferase brn-like isoform X1 [Maniola hyperantus]
MRRRKAYKYCVCACILVYIYYFFGVSDYFLTKSYDDDFDYPLNINIRPVVNEVLSGRKPSVAPINLYPYRFLTNSGKCSTIEKLDLFIVVKSAMNNFDKRHAIRQTYGQDDLIPGRIVKILFFLGIDQPKSTTQKRVEQEMSNYKDIIQIDFQDSYYNNTIKTMMSFRWLYQHCSTADFYLFTDDDMYISVNNLLDYVHDSSTTTESANEMEYKNIEGYDRDSILFAGYVFNSIPQRFHSSKWRVSIEEYPWNKWPPYVTAGAFVVSNKCMKVFYVGSLFVKHFRFDDIYLGIVAKKVGIKPTHCSKFHFYKKHYSVSEYRDVIASHGYGDPEELIRVWNEQNVV